MKYLIFTKVILIICLLFETCLCASADQYNIITLNNPAPGYLKLDPSSTINYFLLDNYGFRQYIDTSHALKETTFYQLLSNGNWICYRGFKYYILDPDLNIIDSIPFPADHKPDIHDVLYLNNGHYLIFCSKDSIMDLSNVVTGGDSSAIVFNGIIFETDRTGTIYWTWNALEHFDITEINNLEELRRKTIDFPHFNSLALDLDGNLLVSSRHLDEITKIDRTTGNIIWRLGGARCVANQFTFVNDSSTLFYGFSSQHDISVLSNGNIMMFDNGNLNPAHISRAVEYSLNLQNMTATKVWEYYHSPAIFQESMGSVQRLPNGNTLINWGLNFLTEVKPDNSVALEINFNSTNYTVRKHIVNMNSVTKNIINNTEYSFNEQGNQTDITLNVSSHTGNGTASIEKHYYKPPVASFLDSNFTEILPYRWVLSQNDISGINGRIRFNASNLGLVDDLSKISIYKRNAEASGVFTELNTNYNISLNEIYADFSGFGEFILCSYILPMPALVYPKNDTVGTNINGIVVWNKLKSAGKFRIQISEFQNFQSLTKDTNIISDTIYHFSQLNYNQKYYWRVCGINDKDTSQWSDVFNFTTILPAPVSIFPVNNSYSIHLTDSIKWSKVTGAQHYKIQISLNDQFLNLIVDEKQISNEYYLIKNLNLNTRYYWRTCSYRSTDTSAWSAIESFNTILLTPNLVYPSNDTFNIALNGYLSWDAVLSADSYSIQLSRDSLFTDLIINKFKVRDNFLQFDSLENDTKYFWRVRSVNNYDSSDWTPIFNFNTFLTKPFLKFPANDSVNVSSDIELAWESYPDAKYYSLQVSLNKDFDTLLYDVFKISKTYYQINNLPNKSKIYWRINVSSGKKSSEWSDSWKFTTSAGIPLQVPVLILPSNNSTNNYPSGEFTWNTVPKAVKYIIQVSLFSDFNDMVFIDTALGKTSISYTDLGLGLIYYWRVKAFSINDSSEWSDTWNMKTIDSDKLPLLTLISPSYDDLQVPLSGQLKWLKVNDADSYIVQLSLTASFDSCIINKNSVKDEFVDYTGLTNYTPYFWRVKYVVGIDTSAWSDIWVFHTESIKTLDKPTLTFPLNAITAVPANGKLSWNSIQGAESYRIVISKSNDFRKNIRNEFGITNTSLDYYGLEFNTLYYWRVAAFSSDATSQWSQTRYFTSELPYPFGISPINESQNNIINGELKWTEIQGSTFYYLQIATDSLFDKLIVDEKALNSNIYDYYLEKNTKYFWRVKALNSTNESSWSQILTFTTGSVISVNDLFELEGLKLLPNPVNDFVMIKFGSFIANNLKISIFNTNAEILLTQYVNYEIIKENSIKIDVSSLPNGAYFAIIKSKNSYKSLKFEIIR